MGKMDGLGKLYDKRGVVIQEGKWANGKFIADGAQEWVCLSKKKDLFRLTKSLKIIWY